MHQLDEVIAPYHLLKHPFYQRWREGTLHMDELRNYAIQYYPHVKAFPTYVSAVHSRCEDLATRQMLLENLREEEEGEDNHPELWLRFAEGLGQTREECTSGGKATPEALNLVQRFRELTRKSFASGLGALYAYESQVPPIATQKIDGLKRHFGITEERALQFFSVHEKADVYHSESERNAFDQLSPEEQSEAAEAACKASRSLWDFLSSLG